MSTPIGEGKFEDVKQQDKEYWLKILENGKTTN
jgi:hypothetical protein